MTKSNAAASFWSSICSLAISESLYSRSARFCFTSSAALMKSSRVQSQHSDRADLNWRILLPNAEDFSAASTSYSSTDPMLSLSVVFDVVGCPPSPVIVKARLRASYGLATTNADL